MLGAIQSASPKMPAIYISKYNRFVDNIIGRINRILGKSYDPVRVKLQSNEIKKTKSGTKKRKITKRKNMLKTNDVRNKMGELSIARNKMEELPLKGRATESEVREPAFVLISKAGGSGIKIKNITINSVPLENRGTNMIRGNSNNNKNKTKRRKNNKNDGNNSKQTKKTPKARATLYGLSSLKRDGDVTVNMMNDHTTVKTNFLLGPLTLRVEREIGKGSKRELKSATATTAEMVGRLNLKIMHGGAATLHAIRVLQPKQVRVDSTDDHEKTKEFMWKRSSHIASVVSQKLAAAARSMLKPPPRS